MVDRVERKIEEQRVSIIEELSSVMKSSEERVMQKIGELAAETANLKQSIAAIQQRVAAVENSCAEVLALRSEIVAVRNQLNELESSAVATDLIINGIPLAVNESLPDVFARICRAVQHKTPPLRDAFRLRKVNSKTQRAATTCLLL